MHDIFNQNGQWNFSEVRHLVKMGNVIITHLPTYLPTQPPTTYLPTYLPITTYLPAHLPTYVPIYQLLPI
jgi:hypothetical protein